MNESAISKTEKWLQIILILSGAVLLMAVVPIFFPISLMSTIHERLGLGEFPDRPITAYLARSTSALYAMEGAIMVFVGLNLRKLWLMVPLIGVLHFIFGLVVFGIDLTAPMPWYWTAAEGLPVSALGVLFIWLWKIADRKRATSQD